MEFCNLNKQHQLHKTEIDSAMQLEEKLAEYIGVKHCITCANGTDALQLALMDWGLEKAMPSSFLILLSFLQPKLYHG